MDLGKLGALAVCVLTLVACGDSGGGGGGLTGGDGVRVQGVQPATFARAINKGEQVPLPSFALAFSGDLSGLQGKQLFLAIEDPGGLIAGQLQMTGIGTSTVAVGGSGATMPTAGEFTGTLTFHVCYDAGCATELPGSPSVSRYTIDVAAGFVLEASVVELTVGRGADPSPLELHATLPVGATDLAIVSSSCKWDYLDPASFDFGGPCLNGLLGNTRREYPEPGGTAIIRVDPGPIAVAGTYEMFLDLESVTDFAHGRRRYTAAATIRYIVTP